MTDSGVSQMIQRRAKQAGVTVTLHSFRRSFAVRWLRSGLPESLLMNVTGWSSPTMIRRYTATVSSELSIEAQRSMLEAEHAAARATCGPV
jgi:integrase